jgi:hypothetical protein
MEELGSPCKRDLLQAVPALIINHGKVWELIPLKSMAFPEFRMPGFRIRD